MLPSQENRHNQNLPPSRATPSPTSFVGDYHLARLSRSNEIYPVKYERGIIYRSRFLGAGMERYPSQPESRLMQRTGQARCYW
jgi:hypothetical protein